MGVRSVSVEPLVCCCLEEDAGVGPSLVIFILIIFMVGKLDLDPIG